MADYIEREALIKKLRIMPIPKQAGSANTWLDNCAAGVNAAIREVASFPAADVAPVVHSYWEHKITNDGENIGICHNCKYPVSWFWEQAKYCPNCGAKMDGGDGDAKSV